MPPLDLLRAALAALAGLFAAIILYGFHPVHRFRLRHVPGRRPRWLTGGILDLRARGASAVHAESRRLYGPVWQSWGASRPFVLTVDPTAARDVMLKNYNRPAFATLWQGQDAAFERYNLLSARGAHHHALRSRLWAPIFYKGSLDMARPVVAAHADALAARAATAAACQGGLFDAAAAFKATTLDVIGSVAFGVDFRAADPGSTGAALKAAIEEIVAVNGLAFSPWGAAMLFFPVAAPLWQLGSRFLPDAGLTRVRATRQRVIAVAERLLADHRAALAAAGGAAPAALTDTRALRGGVAPGSFLDVATRAVDPSTGRPFPDMAIINQAFLSILAGTDTTANALTFATHALSLPTGAGALARLVAEVDARGGGGSLSIAETVCSWPYMDAVFKETLRVWPPAPMLARELGDAGPVGGVRVPAGQWVGVPLLLLHRDEAVWGPTASEFCPERWLDEGHPATASPAARKAFLPFGDGARRCPAGSGRGGLAELEFKTVLACLLRVATPRAVEGQAVPLPLRQTITLAPKDGLTVVLVPRKAGGGGAGGGGREA